MVRFVDGIGQTIHPICLYIYIYISLWNLMLVCLRKHSLCNRVWNNILKELFFSFVFAYIWYAMQVGYDHGRHIYYIIALATMCLVNGIVTHYLQIVKALKFSLWEPKGLIGSEIPKIIEYIAHLIYDPSVVTNLTKLFFVRAAFDPNVDPINSQSFWFFY